MKSETQSEQARAWLTPEQVDAMQDEVFNLDPGTRQEYRRLYDLLSKHDSADFEAEELDAVRDDSLEKLG